jgi:serine/threonine protein kinase
VKLHTAKDAGLLKSRSLTQHCAYLVLEYCEGGELYDYVHDTGRFSEELTRFYFKGILEAIAACHRAGVAHCDIKLDNVLLDAQFQVKLADFGLAIAMGTGESNWAFRGTPVYMAPEIHARRPYDGFAVDVFALGVCLFVMLTRTCPFKSATSSDAHYSLFLKDNARYWQMYSQLTNLTISPDFSNLVNSLLSLDPAHRLSLSEIISHPWMQGAVASDVPQQMTLRKASIAQAKTERVRLEAEYRAMKQTQVMRKTAKERTDYNELVDELVATM